jgi:phage FluMu protein Com
MAAKVKRCGRCNRLVRSGTDWAVSISDVDDSGFGVVDAIYCPRCTTADEHTEQEINDATSDYIWRAGRVAMYPKSSETALN